MVSIATRDEVLAVLADRYGGANRQDRGRILDELVALLGRERDDLTAAERSYVERLTGAEPALATASVLARRFAALVRGGDASGLDAWIAPVVESELAPGVTRDKAAVAAAISEPWSTSPVEGHIKRLRTPKRQMYGRAGYHVLRARMLAA